MKEPEKMVAVIKLKMPVSMWDAEKTAERLKNKIFKESDNWYLSSFSYTQFEFKPKGDMNESK